MIRWKERYPSDTDLRAYFDHVADIWDLDKDIELNVQVTKASFDESSSQWGVQTKDGRTFRCKWLIPATGTSFKQHFPEWKNRDKFKGVIAHSSLWPEDVEISGKRVAVIGAGSTAVQIMQESSKVSSLVTQYIRTPNLALPMRQRTVTEDEVYAYRPTYQHVFKACKTTFAGLPTQSFPKMTFDVSDEERKKIWEEGWRRGGFNWSVGGFMDTLLDPKANRAAYEFWREKTLPRMKNQQKRDLLIPPEPPYYMGTKRPSLEQDYYVSNDNVFHSNGESDST
jgi:cation diffusion facilitator CzcD-associated flavoprotein CzcO